MQPSAHSLEIIRRLMAFPTISHDSNMALIEYVGDLLDGHQVPYELFHNPEGTKANLLAHIGPRDVPGILLSGHTDVVPVEGQPWSQDPFTPWEADGRLYGRGSCDMKGFIGLVLGLLPRLASTTLKTPIHIALSYDEEVGCAGVRSLVDHLAHIPVKPRFALVGEPTDMKVVTAHKGISVQRIMITGRAGHSSQPDLGANALIAAGDILGFIARLAEDLRTIRDERFEPPFTTLNVGRAEGGTAVNIIAEHATIDWEFRPIPAADADHIRDQVKSYALDVVLPKMRTTAPEAEIRFETIATAPALDAKGGEDAEAFMRRLTGANESHAVSFTTEAGLFQKVSGIPAIVCGPGSIAQAHKPDEYVSLEQLARAEAVLNRLVDMAEADPL